jgi:hypothetical protein
MKKHACRYLDIDTSKLWELIPQYAPGTPFDDFHIAVHKLYPGSEDDRKFSISDMDKLVGEQLRIGIHDSNDLGVYYRAFYNITSFLLAKNRISEAEQSRAFVRGFQHVLWIRITHRLELKFPHHYPDDPYPLDDIHDAAKFVLAGSTPSNVSSSTLSSKTSHSTSQHPSHPSTSTPVPTISSSAPQIKQEDLTAILDKFANTIITAITASSSTSTPRTNSPPRSQALDNFVCIFCGHSGHFISECLVCQSYINDGKCIKNAEGKVVLANGQFPARSIPGRFIKDRIDNYHRRHLEHSPRSSFVLDIAPSTSHTSSSSSHSLSFASNSIEARISALEKEIFE